MATTAFPVRQTSEGVGCTDIALRKIFQALYPDKGIITGLTVTGGNTLAYTVTEGVAVCSKGDADGNTLAYFEGGSVDVSANSSSNPRIDVVWITSHDVTQGDDDNAVTIGVTEGTAAASPVEPDIPTYATKLCAMQMPAGASTTSSATQYGAEDVAIPYAGTQGQLAYKSSTYSENQSMDGKWYDQLSVTVTVPTRRLVEVIWTMRANVPSGEMSQCYVRLNIDGANVTDGDDELPIYKFWVRNRFVSYQELSAGTHTIKLSLMANKDSSPQWRWRGVRSLAVFDRGPVD